jgi:outer membrane protein insertion porin family/translocation and assembly module TamA
MRLRSAALLARPLVVAVIGLFTLTTAARAQEIDCDPGDREVRSVRFVGNQTLSADELSARVVTTPSTFTHRYFGWFLNAGVKRCLPSENGLALDVLRLQRFYKDNGFYSASVDTVVALAGAPDRVNVTFRISEGPPALVDSVTITGLDSVRDRDEIVHDLHLKRGARFGTLYLAADVDTIAARLRNAGYPSATVFPAYNAGPNVPLVPVTFDIVTGKRANFGTIAIQRTPADSGTAVSIDSATVLRLLGFQSGNSYSDRAIADAQRNLYNLGVYRHVGVDLDTTRLAETGLADVRLDVREDYVHQINLEEGWATLDCFRVNSQYTDKNFFDRAWRLDLTGRLSKIGYGAPTSSKFTRNLCRRDLLDQDSVGSSRLNYYAGASIRQPTLFSTHWVPSYSVYTERRAEYKAYLRTTFVGGDASATRSLGDRMPFRLGYSVEYGKTQAEPGLLCVLFSACNDDEQKDIRRPRPLAVASASFQRNRTDTPVEPRNGYAFATEGRMSQEFLGSDNDLRFYKFTADLALYRMLKSNVTLAVRARMGFVTGGSTANTNLPPPSERLYAGGASSVRGFGQNELGPIIYLLDNSKITIVPQNQKGDTVALVAKDSVSDTRRIPVGGNTLSVFNLELRIRDPFFPDILQYVPFVDAAELFTEGGTGVSNIKRLFVTPGVGVRYFSPIGPIQGNVGYNPTKTRAGQAFFTPSGATTKRPLICVTAPGAPVVKVPYVEATNTFGDPETTDCPESFVPFRSNSFFSRLTFTVSIGTSF